MIQSIYLIRHATPDWSRTDLVYHLPPGPPLTKQGLQEARTLGAFLLSGGVRQFYASPLERCFHTAQIAAQVAAAPWQIESGLSEWGPGDTTESVLLRAWPVFERVSQEGLAKGPVALVTHGGPVSALLQKLGVDSEILAQHKALFDHNNPLPPAGAWLAERPSLGAAWSLRLAFKPEPVQSAL